MILNRGTQTITTERLILRKFKESDADMFYKLVGNDSEVTKYVVWNVHENVEATKRKIGEWINEYNNDYKYHWAITLKESNTIIGSISCVKVDIKNEVCELGYVISSTQWNNGYATETLKAVIKYLFEEGFKTIYAMHLKLNPASGKVMIKSGMEYEGTLKNRMKDKTTGKYDDLLSYSIIQNEEN